MHRFRLLGWAGAVILFALALLTVPALASPLDAHPVPTTAAAAALLGAAVLPLWLEITKR